MIWAICWAAGFTTSFILRRAIEIHMTAYRKNLLAWAIIMLIGLSLIISALYISGWFLVPFFLFIYVPQFFLNRITCPNCGTPVTYQGTFSGIRIRGGFVRKKCQECGWDLDKSSLVLGDEFTSPTSRLIMSPIVG